MEQGLVNIYRINQHSKSEGDSEEQKQSQNRQDGSSGSNHDYVPSFMMVSTASVNVENDSKGFFDEFEASSPELERLDLQTALEEISQSINLEQEDIELVIAIHGYNTNIINVKKWFKDIAAFANRNPTISQNKNRIFLGYRWPSENVRGSSHAPQASLSLRFKELFSALPIVPYWIALISFFSTILLSALLIILTHLTRAQHAVLLSLDLASLFAFAIIFSLVLLRLTVYFRDSYRANNYAVPDLVEIIRQIDKSLMNSAPGITWGDKKEFWSKRKVKLSFIGHSMGGFVVTSAVRILSDVFDPRSIGTLLKSNTEKAPDNEIGNTFKLGRLVLVSPDIPVESILEGRANFLSSSLRRFEEAYLFSNEGDLALRLASTAANYFSYPAKSRTRGYRLGNVAITSKEYGIINLESVKQTFQRHMSDSRLEYITVGFGKNGTKPILDRSNLEGEEKERSIAELFTFIDCTDYIDTTTYTGQEDKEIGVVSYSAQKQYLGLWNYVRLAFGYFFLGKDVHGGYFRGDYVRDLMYKLAFVGFREYLDSVTPNTTKLVNGLELIDNTMKEHRIQTVLSPERYAMLMKEGYNRSNLV